MKDMKCGLLIFAGVMLMKADGSWKLEVDRLAFPPLHHPISNLFWVGNAVFSGTSMHY